MTRSFTPNLYLGLVHHPVLNKHGEIIASAVTNLDIHDLARAARTYGVRAVYVVTPLEDQQILMKQIVSHWTSGVGGVFNPDRKTALELVSIQDSIQSCCEDIRAREQMPPVLVATSARMVPKAIPIHCLRQQLAEGSPHLLLFGTAWGLAPECLSMADHILHPIRKDADYNHLSVRSAASILLDRLAG